MSALKVIALILGVVLILAGLAAMAGGGVVLGLDRSYSDDDGFFMTPSQTIGSNGFALTVPDINEQLTSDWQRWGLARAQTTLRVTGLSKLPAPVFIGVGPTGQVSQYVSGVTRDRVTGVDLRAGTVEYDHVDGNSFPASPRQQDFWTAQVSGAGSQTLEWALEQGDWAVVIMNADASAPVAVDVRLGARFGIIQRLIVGLFAGGAALLAIGVLLLYFGFRRRRAAPGVPPPMPPTPPPPVTYIKP